MVRCCKEEPSLKGTIVNHLGVLIIPRRRRRRREKQRSREGGREKKKTVKGAERLG